MDAGVGEAAAASSAKGAGAAAAGAGAGAAGAATAAGASSALATAATTAVIGAAASTILGSLMQPKMPNAPGVSTPQVMPSADDAAAQKAKTDSIIAQMSRGGRASTILTDNGNNKLGGG